MTKVKMSPKGEFLLPKELMEAHGFTDGAEIEVSGGPNQILLSLVEKDDSVETKKMITIEEFIAKIPRYDGPPITNSMIKEMILNEAGRRWDRVNRQWHDDKND